MACDGFNCSGFHTIDDADEPVSTELNTAQITHHLQVDKDKLQVTYVGKGNHAYDVGAVLGNRPLPTRRMIYYFEITVISHGEHSRVSIGIAPEDFRNTRHPGWEANSFGYHGDDGRKFQSDSIGDEYGPPFHAGDVIGCGVNFAKQNIFFTKNGEYLGVAFPFSGTNLPVMYPAIGLHSTGENVSVNFGGKPFRFDIRAMISRDREQRQRFVSELTIPPSTIDILIKDYLLFHGYQDTYKRFVLASEGGKRASLASSPGASPSPCSSPSTGATSIPIPAASPTDGATATNGDASSAAVANEPSAGCSMHHRKEIREYILAGLTKQAYDRANELYPGLFSDRPDILLALQCLHFIELVKKKDPVAAVEFARNTLRSLVEQYEEKKRQEKEDEENGKMTDSESVQDHGDGTMADSATQLTPKVLYVGPSLPLPPPFHPPLQKLLYAGPFPLPPSLPSASPKLLYSMSEWGDQCREAEEIVALLAYDDPSSSSLARYVDVSQRERLADRFNAALMQRENPRKHTPKVQRLLQQLVSSVECLRFLAGGHGEVFHICTS